METVTLILLILLFILLVAGVVLITAMMMALSRRVSTVEHSLVETDTIAKSLAETTSAIHTDLSRAHENLASLQAYAKARQELELQTAESIRRLEGVIAGTQTKGAAGENIVEMVFSQLPVDWQVRDFRVGDKTVEFGLRLPNDLVLPIDSKWPATNLLERFLATDEIEERLGLKAQIEKAVLSKAGDVKKYIDPNITVDFGIAAVPDAVFDLCSGIHAESLQMNVVIISYSMFVPYLLLVFQTVLKTSRSIDLQRLNSYLESVQSNIVALQNELEGRYSRALTMLTNSRDDMRVHLSRVRGGLTSLQLGAGVSSGTPQLDENAER